MCHGMCSAETSNSIEYRYFPENVIFTVYYRHTKKGFSRIHFFKRIDDIAQVKVRPHVQLNCANELCKPAFAQFNRTDVNNLLGLFTKNTFKLFCAILTEPGVVSP